MIHHDVDQNTREWQNLRLGLATSSAFHRIMTPKKRQLSAQADDYMYALLAEWISGEPLEGEYHSPWMERGQALEDQAIAAYEGLTGRDTERGGFWTTDDGMIGCSPDRIVSDDGLLEIKCPLLPRQVAEALGNVVSDEHQAQLQGQMMISERKWVDVFSFHPLLILEPRRILRNEDFIADLRRILTSFIEVMLKARQELLARYGPFHRPSWSMHAAPALEAGDSRDFVTDQDVEDILREQRERREL
jgi:hypothetical protein